MTEEYFAIPATSARLMHYGILRRSGRYPWGSGKDEGERANLFFGEVKKLRDLGMSDVDIAKSFGMTTTDFRITNSIARNQKRASDIAFAQRLREKGMSNVKIGERMGIPESSVRSLLAPGQKEKTDILVATSNMLRDQVEKKGVLDVGAGVGPSLGLSKERLATAVSILKDEGYAQHTVQVDQAGTNNKTSIKVLAKPGTTYRDIVSHPDYPANVKSIAEFTSNNGKSWYGTLPPVSVDSSRIKIAYKEDGGDKLDGVMYIRPGKEDLSLGGAHYAQVRVMVDGTHYLKGMAMYKDDLPRGVDIVFNTNKSKASSGPEKTAVMKELVIDQTTGKVDKDNPFGAVFKQIGKENEKGEVVEVTSAMNIVNKEGQWNEWKNTISTQVLSKQTPEVAKGQLDMTYDRAKSTLDEIMALNNPTVKKKLLEDFAETVDSSAVHLKAASLPRQRSQVILPLNSLKDNEVYAPNFRNGEQVVLIRYPHAGPFEIPSLTVNNRHPEAKKLLGQAVDAIAINSNVAERLSGADFDGDSVLVIPNPASNPKIKTAPPLEKLQGFDPKTEYPAYEGMPKMTPKIKGQQMGLVSNLITDMTIKGATPDELARAVKHSMVVIDAEKHNLNYKESAKANGIPALMEKYQGKKTGGSATLISRASSQIRVPERKRSFSIDPVTGEKVYRETGAGYTDSKGRFVMKTTKSKKLAEAKDAYDLVSEGGGTRIEKIYADHSNRLKAMANQARRESLRTGKIEYSPSAAKHFKTQVDELTAALRLAEQNAPRERQAQVIAARTIKMKRDAAPDMDNTQLKRVKSQALDEARRRTGAGKQKIHISDEQWSAIQAGAITPTKLSKILQHADEKRVKELATPRTKITMSASKTSRARQMQAQGYTMAEIADHLGVSINTLSKGLKDNG